MSKYTWRYKKSDLAWSCAELPGWWVVKMRKDRSGPAGWYVLITATCALLATATGRLRRFRSREAAQRAAEKAAGGKS